MTHHIAQINIGTLLYDLDDPRLGEFMGNLDRINAVAEASPGFVWRLKDQSGNATAIRAFDDPRMAINMSVWTSIAALQHFAYRSEHVQFMRRRLDWFEPHTGVFMALWWVAAGEIPVAADGLSRLALYQAS